MQAHEIEQLLRPGVVVLTPQIFADILSRVYNFVLVILVTDDFLEIYIFINFLFILLKCGST